MFTGIFLNINLTPSIHPSIHLSIHPSIHPSSHASILKPCIYQHIVGVCSHALVESYTACSHAHVLQALHIVSSRIACSYALVLQAVCKKIIQCVVCTYFNVSKHSQVGRQLITSRLFSISYSRRYQLSLQRSFCKYKKTRPEPEGQCHFITAHVRLWS